MNATEPVSNSFAFIAANHCDGQLNQEMSDAVRDVVQAVRQTGKSGKIVLEMDIQPASKGAGNAIVIKHQVTPKKPKFEKDATIFFADDQHNLYRENPMQKQFDLRTVDKPVAEERAVASTPAREAIVQGA